MGTRMREFLEMTDEQLLEVSAGTLGRQFYAMAVLLSRSQQKSADRMETMTRWVTSMTIVVALCTAVSTAFVVLSALHVLK